MSGGPSIIAKWNTRHLRLAIDAAGIALWSWNVDTDRFTMDPRGYDLWNPTAVDTEADFIAAELSVATITVSPRWLFSVGA